MRLAINICISLLVLTVFVWLAWPNPEQWIKIQAAVAALDISELAPYLLAHVVLLAFTHFCRAWRWNNLLAPIGVQLSPARLMAISSVGFMAILMLPIRLGEFVRPALIRQKGKVSATAAMGTVAVERIVDGLLVSLFVFGALFSIFGINAPLIAYLALAVFSAAMLFLVFAIRWPKPTIRFWLTISLIPRISTRLADMIEKKLLQLISGFLVLKDKRNLLVFTAWSIVYWGSNGVSVWVLAQGFGLDLSFVGACATVGIIAVGLSLPNAPGLIGQFNIAAMAGLGYYLAFDNPDVKASAEVFSFSLWAIQVIWYIGIGCLALRSRHVSFSEIREARDLED